MLDLYSWERPSGQNVPFQELHYKYEVKNHGITTKKTHCLNCLQLESDNVYLSFS